MHLLDYYLDIFGTLNKHLTWTKLGFEMHAENAGFGKDLGKVHERVALELFKPQFN